MTRRLLGVLCILVAVVSCSLQEWSPTSARDEIASDDLLIVLTRPPTEPLLRAARGLGYEVLGVERLNQLGDRLVSLRIPAGRSIPEAIAEIERAVPGVTAGANHIYRLQSDAAPTKGRSYAGPLIGWPETGCRAVRRVGLMDSGVAADTAIIAEGRVTQRRFVPGDAPPANRHGVAMAELLVGPGRLTGTRLYSANVIDPNLRSGDSADVMAMLRAINWLAENGVEVVNVSLAGPRNKLLNRAMQTATANGMLFVAAAGNDGATAPPRFPAAFPYVLAVTAVDSRLRPYRKAVRGAHMDVAAPGVDILVRGGQRAQILSGTSAAVPFVTAALAADRGLGLASPENARRRLAEGARDLGAPGWDETFGLGLIAAPKGCAVSPDAS